MRFQGTRILVVRKTRASLSQTFLVTLEQVLANLHPEALTGCQRGHVSAYTIGLSEIVPLGMEDEERLRSLECAVVFMEEATEFTQDDYNSLQGALRWPVGGWKQMILACNPGAPSHWIWKLYLDGKIHRLASTHADNPTLTPDYMQRLSELPGVMGERFYRHKWVAAEGQVLDNWTDANMVDVPENVDGTKDYGAMHLAWYFAAKDWGFTKAGALGVFGVDFDGRVYLVAQIYKTRQDLDWWCARLVELHQEFSLQAIVADPSRPDMIAGFNRALGFEPDAPTAPCFGANNKRASAPSGDLEGILYMRSQIDAAKDGKPRFFVCRDSLRLGIDQTLRDTGKPCCFEEEVTSWVWAKSPDGTMAKDHTEATCEDHAVDMVRYGLAFARDKNLTPDPGIAPDVPGSYGAMYGHNKLVALLAAEQAGLEVDWSEDDDDV
jgi:hypothetical protein